MTYGAFTQEFAPYSYGRQARRLDPKIGLCIIALGATTAVGIWALCPHTLPPMPQIASLAPSPAAPMQKTAPVVAKPAETAHRTADAAPQGVTPHGMAPYGMAIALRQAATREAGLLDPALTSSYAAVVFARNAPLRTLPAEPAPAPDTRDPVEVAVAVPEQQVVPEQKVVSPLVAEEAPQEAPEASAPPVADVPLPQRRPTNLGAIKPTPSRVASADRDAARPSAAAPSASGELSQPPSFFDKLFGRPKESGPVLAYAAPEDGMIGNVLKNAVGSPAAYDRYTAIYNITTHTVTLPDGTQLEAHSGLGAARDNPRSVAQRMVGATPPNVYDLTPREALFHGVRALRMTPTGGTTFGRAGLLTHTYMLRGHSGESNGCVVFRNYEAFLRAYDSGAIRRLAVVAGG